jgi:hypothetical protein
MMFTLNTRGRISGDARVEHGSCERPFNQLIIRPYYNERST